MSDPSPSRPLLSLRGVRKRFGEVEALAGVDLDFAAGEIHAVLGENGAGKSTLMHVVYGLVAPDGGSIVLDGREVYFRSPIEARRAGIDMVHQEVALVDALSVAENLALALDAGASLRLHRSRIIAEARQLASRIGLEIGSLEARAGDLPVGVRQRIEILKALGSRPRILILDEPTAVLTPGESTQLFRVLQELRAQGRTILFITHKLAEVMEVADRVTVMRQGRVVATRSRADVSLDSLAELMIGAKSSSAPPLRHRACGSLPALRLDHLWAKGDRGASAVNGLSATVFAGEILGIAGVDGNGQWELFQVLAGLRRLERGTIEIEGRPPPGHAPASMIAAGLGFIPPDRRRQGAILPMSVTENALLNVGLLREAACGPILERKAARRMARDLVERFAVRTASLEAPAASLSGGNLQRLIVGRALATRPRVLIAFNPTRGLDIAATQAVFQALASAVAAGTAVLLISTDLDEVLEISDRVAVLYRGRLGRAYERPFPMGQIARQMAGEANQG